MQREWRPTNLEGRRLGDTSMWVIMVSGKMLKSAETLKSILCFEFSLSRHYLQAFMLAKWWKHVPSCRLKISKCLSYEKQILPLLHNSLWRVCCQFQPVQRILVSIEIMIPNLKSLKLLKPPIRISPRFLELFGSLFSPEIRVVRGAPLDFLGLLEQVARVHEVGPEGFRQWPELTITNWCEGNLKLRLSFKPIGLRRIIEV